MRRRKRSGDRIIYLLAEDGSLRLQAFVSSEISERRL